MVTLSDRLDYIVGAKAADPLDEVFGIRTVDDLLRHYPRSYVEGTSVRGAADERPAEGEHVTLVDEITDVVERPIRNRPRDTILLVTLGSGRSKVTATFFNPRYLKKGLTKGTKVMLSGEVGFFRGAMQLTHPAFLILDSPDGRNRGSRSLRNIADASQAVSGEVLQEAFERRFYPIYPASTKLQS
jgi:ATP-dependent DNA helicase RecG